MCVRVCGVECRYSVMILTSAIFMSIGVMVDIEQKSIVRYCPMVDVFLANCHNHLLLSIKAIKIFFIVHHTQ